MLSLSFCCPARLWEYSLPALLLIMSFSAYLKQKKMEQEASLYVQACPECSLGTLIPKQHCMSYGFMLKQMIHLSWRQDRFPSQFAQAAMIKYYRLGGSHNRDAFPRCFGDWTQRWQCWLPVNRPCCLAVGSPQSSLRACLLVASSHKDSSPVGLGYTHSISFYLSCLFNNPALNTILSRGPGISSCEWWWWCGEHSSVPHRVPNWDKIIGCLGQCHEWMQL